MYCAKPGAKLPRHVVQSRIAQGRKLRAMYRSLGLSRAQCAKFLHVSARTLHNWESGRHAIPYAAFKLLRIHCYMELPGTAWRGWSIAHGKLCTPEGHLLSPQDAAWWSLLVRRAETGARAIVELARLRKQIAAGVANAGSGTSARSPQAAVAEPAAAIAAEPLHPDVLALLAVVARGLTSPRYVTRGESVKYGGSLPSHANLRETP